MNHNEDLVSVIIPVYNTVQYLDECISSLVAQSYKNIEILLIDDGSTDGSEKKCDDWAEKDIRIRVVHCLHQGVSAARNTGVALSVGEYISFVDSDDWIDPDYYQILTDAVKINGADIAASGVKKFYRNAELQYPAEEEIVYTAEEALKTVIAGTTFTVMACNKLYKRSLLITNGFPEGKVHEDDFVMYKIIDSSSKLVFCHSTFYHYRQRIHGIIGLGISNRFDDKYDSYRQNEALIQENHLQLMWMMKLLLCQYTVNDYVELLSGQKEETDLKKRIIQYRKSVKFSLEELLKLNRNQLKMVLFSAVCFRGYCRHRLNSKSAWKNQYEYYE